MQRKFFSTFIQLIAIILNTQLLFGPIALAQQAPQQGNGWSSAADYAQMFTGMVGTATQAYMQGRQQGMGGADQVAAIEAQLSPMLKIQPIDPRQVPPVFNGCLVLPASGTTMTSGMSCKQASDSQVMSGYTEAVINIAEFNKKQLENYTTKGHERFTTQGVGCYEKKLEDFEGSLLAREEELSKLQNSLKEKIEAFKLATKNDLEGMKKRSALLTGTPAKYLKDIKFDELFIGPLNDKNKVCASVFSKASIDQAGKGGFRSIEKAMFTKMTDGSGGFSPEEMLSKAKSIKDEINSLSNALADKVSRRADLQVNLSSTSVNSKLFDNKNKALEKVVNNFNSETKEELTTLEKELRINQALSGDEVGLAILKDVKEGDISLDQRLADYERLTKKSCLLQVIKSNWGSPGEFASGFKNPNVSNKMRNRADNSFATQIASEINDPETTFEDIMKQINSYQKQGLNNSKIMITGKSFTLKGKTISASTPLRATQLMGILTDNCKSEFDKRKNSSGFTKRDIVKKIQSYGNQVKNLRKTASSKLKSLLRNELIECKNDTTTGTTDNSCSGALDMNKPGFCVKTAQLCASNFKGCYDKAQTFTKETRKEQVKLAEKYNGEVDKLKKQMKRDLLGINQFMETQARSLDAQLRIGTVFQVNKLNFNLNENFLYDGADKVGLDDELQIEDPEKILEMANQQISALKEQLVAQRNEQMGKLNTMKSEYIGNYNTQKSYWQGIIGECQGRNQAFDQADAKRREDMAANDAEINRACQELRTFNQAPNCDEVGELMENVLEASLKAPPVPGGPNSQGSFHNQQALGQLQKIKSECATTSDSYPVARTPSDAEMNQFCDQIVRERAPKESYKACLAYKKSSKKYKQACTADIFYKAYDGKNFCKNSNDDYVLAPNNGAGDCSTKESVNNSVKSITDDVELIKIQKDLASNVAELETIVAELETIKEKITDTKKTVNTENQDDLLTLAQLEKTKDELEKLVKELTEKFIARKKELEDNNQAESRVAQSEATAAQKPTKLSKENKEDVYSLLADLNSYVDKTKCYNPYDPPDEIEAVQDEVKFVNASNMSGRQMGEQNISLAMCNGNFDGMYDGGGWGQVANEAAGAAGMWMGSMQER